MPPPPSLPLYLPPLLLLNGLLQSLLTPYLSSLLLSSTSTLTLDGRILSVFFGAMYLPFAAKLLYSQGVITLERWWLTRYQSRQQYTTLTCCPQTAAPKHPSMLLLLLFLATLTQTLSFLLSLIYITPYFAPTPPPATPTIRVILFCAAFLRNLSCAISDYLITATILRIHAHAPSSTNTSLPTLLSLTSLYRYYGSLLATVILLTQALSHVDSTTYTCYGYVTVCVICMVGSVVSACYIGWCYRGGGEEGLWMCYYSHEGIESDNVNEDSENPVEDPGEDDVVPLHPPTTPTPTLTPLDTLYLLLLQSFLIYLTFTPTFATHPPLKIAVYVATAALLAYPLYHLLGGEGRQRPASVFSNMPRDLLYLLLRQILPNLTYLTTGLLFTKFPTGPMTSVCGVVGMAGGAVACRVGKVAFEKVGVRGAVLGALGFSVLMAPAAVLVAGIPGGNGTVVGEEGITESVVNSTRVWWWYLVAGAVVFVRGFAGELEFLPLLTLCTTSSVKSLERGATAQSSRYESVVARNERDLMKVTTNESLFIDVTNIISDWVTPSYVLAVGGGGDYTQVGVWWRLVAGVMVLKGIVGTLGVGLLKEKKME